MPTARWSSKWKRLTSESKSTGSEKQHPMVHARERKDERRTGQEPRFKYWPIKTRTDGFGLDRSNPLYPLYLIWQISTPRATIAHQAELCSISSCSKHGLRGATRPGIPSGPDPGLPGHRQGLSIDTVSEKRRYCAPWPPLSPLLS